MSDTSADVDPDRVVTEGELAAVIVVSVLIFILLVIQIALLIYIFCRKKRCPCSRKKSEADTKPYYENRYGEISWSYAAKKIHRDSKRSDEESLVGEDNSLSEDSRPRVVGIDDEHTKKAPPSLKEEVKDLGEDELVPDDEAKDNDDDATKEDDEAKKDGDEAKKDDDDSKKDDDEAKKDDDEAKKESDEARKNDDDAKKEDDSRLLVGEDEDEHTKELVSPLKHEDVDDKQKKEEDLDPDDGRKTNTAPPPDVAGRVLEKDPRVIGQRMDPQYEDPSELDDDTELQGQDKTGTDPFNKDQDNLKDEGQPGPVVTETPVGEFDGDEDQEEDDTSTSRSSVTSSATSLQSHVHVMLPGQPGGEDVPVTMDRGLRKGKFRPPISEYTKGLPAGLPRFSLPPKGIIDAWTDPPEVKEDSNPFDKLWTLEDIQEDEDQGYSDPLKSKGHDQNGSESTGSFETEEGSGDEVVKGVGLNGRPGAGVSGPTELVGGTGGRPHRGSLGGRAHILPHGGSGGGQDKGSHGTPDGGSHGGTDGGPDKGPHGAPDRDRGGSSRGTDEGPDRGPHGVYRGAPGRTNGGPDRGSHGGNGEGPDRGPHGGTLGEPGRRTDGGPDRGSHGGNHGGPRRKTDGGPDTRPHGGADGGPGAGTHGGTGGRPGHLDNDNNSKADKKKNKNANTKDPTSRGPASKDKGHGKGKAVSGRWADGNDQHKPDTGQPRGGDKSIIPLGNENHPQFRNGRSIKKPTDNDKAKGTSKGDDDKLGFAFPGGAGQRQGGNDGDSGFGRGESSIDGSLKGKRVEGGYVIDDDDDISYNSEDGPYYWPDRKGRYRGMDQWYDTDDSAALDLNIEDLEFDDRNQVIRPGGSGSGVAPNSTTMSRHPKTKIAFGETNKGATSRRQQRNKRRPFDNTERNPETETLLGVTKGDLPNKWNTKDEPPRTQRKVDKRNVLSNRGKAPKGSGSNRKGTSNGEMSRADGDLSGEDESSDSCYGYRVLGRPPIKEDQNTRSTKLDLNITATLDPDREKLNFQGVRLGRGLPEGAVIEDNEDSSNEEVEYFQSGSLRIKRYRKTGRRRVGDGEKQNRTEDTKVSVQTRTLRLRIGRASGQDDGVSEDEVPGEQTESGRKKRRRRRRGRQKKDKLVRGPKDDRKWDAYLQYYGDDMYSLLKMIFMESDDDYR
ncbi:uncharacterized protein [Haliotis asinina]|uniref:uncharacterized protein n=1 Tax=Haliotis asinina TaxID=109174 RepID=UPI0035321A30